MLSFLPPFILGPLSLLLIVTNTLVLGVPLLVFSFIKMVLPVRGWRNFWTHAVLFVTENWAAINVLLCRYLLRIEWDVEVHAKLESSGTYLVLPNHQSWSDIIFMHSVLNKKIPFVRFFLKQELIWIPVLNVAWLALDFPFMKRYTKEEIDRNPSLKGKDIETTRKSCEKFKDMPVVVANFLEGTRFTQEKHDKQQSPFKHLLKPKSGGIAFALSAMEGRLNRILDVNIAYPRGHSGIWDLMCGRLTKVVIRVTETQVPQQFLSGDYENDAQFRQAFQDWVSAYWQSKDAQLDSMKQRI